MRILRLKKNLIQVFVLLVFFIYLPTSSIATLASIPETTADYLLEVTINGTKDAELVPVYIDKQTQVFLPLSFLTRSRIQMPQDAPPTPHPEHSDFFSLSSIPWIQSTLDLPQQRLSLMLPPDKFKERQLNPSSIPPPALTPKDSGLYLNYDTSVQHTKEISSRSVGALNELVYFNPQGVGSFSHLLNTSSAQSQSVSNNNSKFVRLETNWTVNKPQEQATWRWGDAISRASDWGGSVRFGGLQWSTNFGIQPNFISYPLPSVKGQSSLPSNVDIFVNDTLRQSYQVDHGSFGLNELPVVTGQGQISMVTQDILGRRQEIVIPYYVSAELLKPGLSDFSFEGGKIRENYGIDSFTYGKPVGVATYRRGITDQWTSGGHSEVTSSFQNMGLTNQVKIADWALLSHSFAISKATFQQIGFLHSFGFSRQDSDLGFGGKAEVTQGKFLRLGNSLCQPTPWLTLQTYASLSLKDHGSISLSYSERRQKQMSLFRYTTASYQRNIFKNLFFTISGSTAFQGRQEQQIGIYLNWRLDDRTFASSTTQLRRQQSSQALTLQRSLPTDIGWGYRLQASEGAQRHSEVSLEDQEDYANFRVRASRDNNTNNVELSARGSVLRMGGATFFTRQLGDGFGLVQMPTLKSIPVYSNNHLIGETDDQGNLIIPRLISYHPNKISVDVRELPLTTSLTKDTIHITPPSRSGVIATFPFQSKKIINFKLKTTDGQLCAPGTVLEDQSNHEINYVGLEGDVCLQTTNSQSDIYLKVYTSNPSMVHIKIPSNNQDICTLEDQQCNDQILEIPPSLN